MEQQDWFEMSKTTPADFNDAWEDEFGVIYSNDRKRLLRSSNPNLLMYTVPEGTEVICNGAFSHVDEEEKEWETYEGYSVSYQSENSRSKSLRWLELPSTLRCIGHNAFYYCEGLTSVEFAPDSVVSIGGSAFAKCFKLTEINLPDSIVDMGWNALPLQLKNIKLPSQLKEQPQYYFGVKLKPWETWETYK